MPLKSPHRTPWLSALQTHWGFEALRPHQEGPVQALCSGQDALAVLPTGGGKSLCYQLTGLVRGGVTLVISPLIALMQDQTADLKSRGLRVWNLSGMNTPTGISDAMDNVERSQPCFLFISPERLENSQVTKRLPHLDIRTVAVDEAHCISEWGHDFRPSYRKIARLRKLVPNAVWGAFTATATPQVTEDIREQLELKTPAIFKHSSRRNNLAYSICQSRDPQAMLLRAAHHAKGCGIIYAGTRFLAEKWADRLKKLIPEVTAYHAGLSKEVRKQRLQDWLDNKTRIVVCTSAFGMGIDKPDVRWVFHASIPPNIEAYIQEAGRAGRDGQPSDCVLFTNDRAIQMVGEKIRGSNPADLPVQAVYQSIANHGAVATGSKPEVPTRFDGSEIAEQLDIRASSLNRCLLLLQQAGYIGAIKDAATPSLLISFSTHACTELHELDADAPEDNRLISHLAQLARKGHVKWPLTSLFNAGYEEAHVLETLNRLQTWGILQFKRWNDLKSVEWKQPRQATKDVVIPVEFTQQSYERSVGRWEAFEAYLATTLCRQLVVSHYFGFEDSQACGTCDNCRINSLNTTLPQWIDSIPEDGISINTVLKTLPASRYAVFFEGLKQALDAGEVWMEGQKVLKAQ